MLSALPFIVQLISKFLFGAIADCIKRYTSDKPFMLDLVTKFFNSLASFGAAVCILIVGFLGCNDQFWAVFLFCASMGLLSGYIPGKTPR